MLLIDRLRYAANQYQVALNPTFADGKITIPAQEAERLSWQLNTLRGGTPADVNEARRALTPARGADVTLDVRSVERLTHLLRTIRTAADRADRLARGQITGPLSANEAVQMMMRFGRGGR